MKIMFSPPDISDKEIENVVEVLKSGWITTGNKTKLFERRIAEYCHTNKAVCLNSATAALELTLRILGIGPGDEVITSAYTYTASASVIYHVGASIVISDTMKDSFEMDYDKLESLITEKTKAIIAVDVAGCMCDYDKLFKIVEAKKDLYSKSGKRQDLLGRIAVIADAAHSFGAERDNKVSGHAADFTCFSFHAVKNLTTAEGGAATWKEHACFDDEDLYKEYMLYSLHGQSKDALAKNTLGAWEYDIIFPGYKCNMTDIMAAIGLGQLDRYQSILERRKEIVELYNSGLQDCDVDIIKHEGVNFTSSMHLYLVRLNGKSMEYRNNFIVRMAERGITTNVHYKPLPLLSAYRNLGYDISDYPNALKQYENEITLPLHTLLSDDDVKYVVENFRELLRG